MKTTHWRDDRKFAITDEYRTEKGGEWAHFYNTPCYRSRNGRIVPLRKCGDCKGKGRDSIGDHCQTCGGSGGLPPAPTEASRGE
jgi:hypothetical protein